MCNQTRPWSGKGKEATPITPDGLGLGALHAAARRQRRVVKPRSGFLSTILLFNHGFHGQLVKNDKGNVTARAPAPTTPSRGTWHKFFFFEKVTWHKLA